MAGSALLEREIEKITGETQGEKELLESAEEFEHRQKMGENLRDLIERRVEYTAPSENYEPEHVYQYSDFGYSEHSPVVPNSPQAPSASNRIADYLAANRNLEEMRARSEERYGDGLKRDVFERALAQVFPGEYAEPVDEYEYYEPTEEEELYRQGILMNADFEPERERVQMPVYSPSYMMEQSVVTEEDEDARPTPRTMGHIHEAKEPEDSQQNVPAGLSAKTKVILAALAATIAILIAIISINTAVLNSVRASIREREGVVTELTETLTGIESEIDDLTSVENVEKWANLHGMTPPNP